MLQLNSLKKQLMRALTPKKYLKKKIQNLRTQHENERNEMQNLLNSIHSKTKISKMFLSIY